ncbi:hypothetical protein [Thermococcus gammatolerans]|uniref:Uncharacterized protein n=1 Tax=Thermococcus gammatolerans (strain DSM 15229 / JCM 11827 / EJ3) TaxID=593117 RepID=C5A657_THEGJ|nr:hypothetical protein [Thermococcus gammatolerans]ACS33719.1 Conserved hypothetical protein [Thermococcus gammatolerans EJ3]
MPYAGFARTTEGPLKTFERIMEELKKRGFEVSFAKHHWAGDMPFGLIIAETNKGPLVIRWSLGKRFELRIEEIDEDAFEDLIDETLDYIGGD